MAICTAKLKLRDVFHTSHSVCFAPASLLYFYPICANYKVGPANLTINSGDGAEDSF